MWAGEMQRYGATVLFVTARSEDSTIMRMMQHEYDVYGDLLVFDFIDAYHQLSVKSFMTSVYHVRRFGGEAHISRLVHRFPNFRYTTTSTRPVGER